MASFGSTDEMRVTKRNGDLENIEFDKILKRIKSTGQEAGITINYTALVMKVIDQLYDTISTTKIDELTAEQCASMSSIHPDYNILAGRIIVSNHHKNTGSSFSGAMRSLYHYLDKHGKSSPLINEELYDVVMANAETLDTWCDFSRDYLIDYFGFKTLERAYLMKIDRKTVERPQHMWLRVALGIHGSNLEKARETYDLMSQKYFTHATPTLFNAGTPHPQLSSCFLLSMESDSIDGIYNTLKDCANISKWAGGIGLHIHNVRASGSHIRGTNGSSNGIVPMLRVFNHTAKYVDQCVHPETIIYTTKGPIQIQHCVMGETEVINLLGKEEVIQNVLEHNYHGEALEIDSMHSLTPMLITPEHPVYALVNQPTDVDFNVIKNCLDNKMCEFEWTDAKELTTNDLLVYPIPSYEKDITTIKEDDCYIYGIILGDDSVNSKTEASDYVSMYTTNQNHIAEFMAKYFSDTCTDYVASTDNNTTCIRWNQNLNLPFRYNDFYDENKKKRMQSRWMHLPMEKAKYILKGLLETDGCNNKELTFDSTSYQLIESVRYLCMRMGVLTSGYIRDRRGELHETDHGTIENKQIAYCLRVPKTREICDLMNIEYNETQFFQFMRYDNFLLSRITEIRPTAYSGQLYDLQMGKEHNYLLHNGLVHNGGGKRNGSFAIYLEPWHADIELFLQMRKNHGDEELKARDLFYALWVPDLFMERVKANGSWTLMCPDECPGLSDVYGDAFKELYEGYEAAGKGRITMKARDLWFQVLDAQMETGTPYLLYKDAANKKSNQKNVGTIKSSNLCTEILEYSDDQESAVCNLASIALPTFLDYSTTPPTFQYDKLHEVTKVVTENLNRIIDRNYYPTEKTRRSNMRHRPVGIGIQGLADTFILMDLAFTSDEAKMVNRQIFETMYHGALERSCELAQSEGFYETFPGSPASEGILQFDMWGHDPGNESYDWTAMKARVQAHGLRNSLLLAPMPTASTSQILGFNECFEPITSNIYSRRTIAGEFVVTNKYLVRDLLGLGLWNDAIKNNVIANNGSIQHIDIIPEKIREKYRTTWEIPMKTVIDMAADRGVFICQSQSMNTWIEEPSYNSLTSMHFYSWGKGLKTGIYYLRRRAAHQAQQFTIEPEKRDRGGSEMEEEVCDMCSG